MNSDLKTKLFANVLLGVNDKSPVVKLPGRSTLSLHAIIAAIFAVLSVAGLLFLIFEKIKPLF